MELDLDLMLQNLNATGTDDRKNGINKFLEAIKNYYQFDNNENNSNSIRILFSNQSKLNELFVTIRRLLCDPDWRIRKDTFEILINIITKDVLKENIDFYLSIILKHLINCLSDSMMTVRKSVTQCLHEYLNRSKNFEKCMQDFVAYGLSSNLDINQRSNNNQALQVLLTSNFSEYNFTELMIGVLNQLKIESDEKRIEGIVISVLKSIKKLVGEDRYHEFSTSLPPEILILYNRCSNAVESQSYNTTPSPWNVIDNGKLSNTAFPAKKFPPLTPGSVNETVYYGFIPQSVMNDFKNDKKLEAIEAINNRFKLCIDKEMKNIFPHLEELLKLILGLMEDTYLVFITSFKLLIDVVSSIPSDIINKYLDLLMQLLRVALTHKIHNDVIIQKYIMAYSMILFQKSDTKELLKMLCDTQFLMDNKQSSIRQTSIDIITSALLKFPSTQFDLDFICAKVSQRLLDKKSKVKQAALECISVIGYNYGNGKTNTLLKIVEQVTKSDPSNSNNIGEAVQSRLSKHRLPNVDDHGLVVYVVDNDKFAHHRQQSIIDLENSSSDNSPISSANPMEKRRSSAGKVRGKMKFPWNSNEGNLIGNTNNHKSIPLSKASGFHANDQIYPLDAMHIQYSQGSLTVSSKELVNEGRSIRKLNDLQSKNTIESDRTYSQPVSGRSLSSENNSMIQTSGYSSGSNTFRNNFESMNKNNKGSSTTTSFNSVTPRNPSTTRQEDSVLEVSPIPTKPALGRSAGSRRKTIDISGMNALHNNNEKISNYILPDSDNQSDIINSNLLQGVRNSASKKKALQIFNASNQISGSNKDFDQDFPRLENSSTFNRKVSQENGNSQNVSNPYKGPTFKSNPQYSAVIVGKGVTNPPIESNEVPTVKNKQPMKGIHHSFSLAQVTDCVSYGIDKNDESIFTNFTIRNNYDVSLINNKEYEMKDNIILNGTGSTSDRITLENETEKKQIEVNYQNLLRQKIGYETSVSPLYCSVNYLSSEDNYPNQLSSRPEFNIVGKSMLETNGNSTQKLPVNNNNHSDVKKNVRGEFSNPQTTFNHTETPPNNKNVSRISNISQPLPDFSNGIIGISIVDKLSTEEDSDEEPNKGIMSNTLRKSLSLKQQKANELHFSKSESNMIQTTPASYSAPGSGSHQSVHRKPPVGSSYYANNLPSSAGNEREITNGYETVPPSRKPLRPALGNSTPKKIKPASQTNSNVQSNSATESLSINPAPLNNPDKSINECLSLIQNDDWENKISAMITVQSLVQFHTETLLNRSPDIHAICMALCKECKNLRSQVAKCAIQTFGQLFIYLRKNLDPVLENIVSNLLSKAGEGTNSFLRQDVEASLLLMIENVSPHRAFNALLQTGSDNKNIAIRRLAACNMMLLCEKLGYSKTMSCIKETSDKILPGIVKFAMDGNQETRYYGKKMLLELSKQQDFDKLINKHIQAKDLRVLKDILENIKVKGIGDPSQFSHSAGMQRSGSLSRGGSAGNLVSLGSKSSPLSRGSSRSMIRLPGSDMSEYDKDWLTKTCSQLTSNDFRDRQNGLDSIVSKTDLQILPQRSISKLLKDLIPRLYDNNTKVTVSALDVCQKIIPIICSSFPTEFFPEFINTIALNFASKSIELRNSASNLMDICFNTFDQSLLIQPCIEAINKSNPKTKPILIDNMIKLLSAIESTKGPSLNRSIGMIIRHVIPEIGLLLEKNRQLSVQMNEQIQNLVVLSYEIVGTEMIDSAAQRGDHTLKQAIIDILSKKNLYNTL